MHIGALLKRSIHAGDEIDFLFHSLQGLHRRSQVVESADAVERVLLSERLHHVAEISFGNDLVCFTRKETSSDNSDGNIKVSHSQRDVLRRDGGLDAFHPGECQRRSADSL